MKIIHSINKYNIEKDVGDKENIGILLTNGLGGYAAFAKENNSRYNGWFVSFGQKVYKIIDDINIQDQGKIAKIKSDFYQAERSFSGGVCESLFVPRERNSLVYELSQEGSVEIALDIRESYDGRKFGRNYEISEENGLTIVKYAKSKNWEEDKTEGKEYEIFLAVKTDGGKIEKIGQWIERHYEYDKRRVSPPFDRHVYKALKIKAEKIVFSAALDKKTAIAEAEFVFKNTASLKLSGKNYANRIVGQTKTSDKKLMVSLAAAKNSLASLMVRGGEKFGVMAGLPWFFQFWTSDEAICLKSVFGIDKEFAKKIILRDIAYINDDGKMYDILYAKILHQYSLNMDAAGWLAKRAAEMKKTGILSKGEVKKKIVAAIAALRKNYLRDGFFHCDVGETWMDTFYAKDIRDGARIEIQALMLSMYKTAFEITGEKKYQDWEKELRENVRKYFWRGGILADGLNDFTIRPNGFIAYYIYPDLLAKKEWVEFFKKALARLWLDWGGIATIDKTSPHFYDEYTGEAPESYHRGDSWYWINNLAALALYRLDANVFKDQIGKILKAGSEELLWHGYLGHLPELSSAKEQRSEGAWAQSWSAAMYIEALEEIAKSSRKNISRLLLKTALAFIFVFFFSVFLGTIIFLSDVKKNAQYIDIVQPVMQGASASATVENSLPEAFKTDNPSIYEIENIGAVYDPCAEKYSQSREQNEQDAIRKFYNALINDDYAKASGLLSENGSGGIFADIFPVCSAAHSLIGAAPHKNGIILLAHSGENYSFGFLTSYENKIILNERLISYPYKGPQDIGIDIFESANEIFKEFEDKTAAGIKTGLFENGKIQTEYNEFIAKFN